jgi:hypothetical protein
VRGLAAFRGDVLHFFFGAVGEVAGVCVVCHFLGGMLCVVELIVVGLKGRRCVVTELCETQ